MKPRTWGEIYRTALRRGDDPGYAGHLADKWKKRQEKKQEKESLNIKEKENVRIS